MAAQVGSGVQDFALTDVTGSVTALVRSNGTVDAAYAYDPYGRVLVHLGGDGRFQFAGGETDAESGLTHFGERYYDPQLLRWTQQDPLMHAADLVEGNRYAYAAGDPVDNVDPAGAISIDVNVSLGPLEGGVEIGSDFSVHPYVGAGGGIGAGASLSADFSRGNPKKGNSITGGGCVIVCLGAGTSGHGLSVGAGPKASAGIHYRHRFR